MGTFRLPLQVGVDAVFCETVYMVVDGGGGGSHTLHLLLWDGDTPHIHLLHNNIQGREDAPHCGKEGPHVEELYPP